MNLLAGYSVENEFAGDNPRAMGGVAFSDLAVGKGWHHLMLS
jgi:hypothetical protein